MLLIECMELRGSPADRKSSFHVNLISIVLALTLAEVVAARPENIRITCD